MTWLTRAAVDRRSVTILLAAGLFIFGVIAWGSLKQELLPDVSFPVATVIAPFPGASAEDVADQVVAPIERAVQSVSGIDQVRSTSANSIGFITAQFEYGTDVDEATAAMEEAIASLTLPEGVDPAVSALNLNASPVVIAAISSETATLSELGRDRERPDRPGARGDRGRRRRRDHRRPRGRGHDHPRPGRARAVGHRAIRRSRPRWRPAASRSRRVSCRRRTSRSRSPWSARSPAPPSSRRSSSASTRRPKFRPR